MTLTPSQFALISTYRKDWLGDLGSKHETNDFQGDDNDLACVVSNICNDFARAGFPETALKAFIANTPAGFITPGLLESRVSIRGCQTEVLKAEFERLSKGSV